MKSPLIQQKVLLIALPMTLASISIPTLGLVDTAILGHLANARFLAAVAAGSSVLTMLFWLFGFLRMGTIGVTARAWGAGDTSRCIEVLAQSLVIAFTLGILLVLFRQPLLTLILDLIKPSAVARPLTMEYCQIRILAAPATLATFCAMGWLLGLQRAGITLLLMLFVNLTNVGFDFLFIVGMKLNSAGAAWASLTAEYLGLALALLLVTVTIRQLQTPIRSMQLTQWSRYRELFRANRHLFVRTACLVFIMTFFTAQGARQGDVILSANAILMQLILLVAFTQDGFAHAAESLAGHAIGKKDLKDFYRICLITTAWGLVIALIATLIYGFFPDIIIGAITNLPEVLPAVKIYWPWLTAMPLVGLACFMADGIFIGSGKTRAMQDSMLIASFLVFLPLWYFSAPLGNHGLWLAYLGFLVARSIQMVWLFALFSKRGQWIAQTC
jgi:MATE family, multidrug efflux pump